MQENVVSFVGRSISLREFMDVYGNVEFEIMAEGHFGNTATYNGWLWETEKASVSAILYPGNRGDRIYQTEEQVFIWSL